MHKVLIVESQLVPRQLFKYIVASSGRYSITACIDNIDEADIFCARGEADLILIDPILSNGSDGLHAAGQIKLAYPHIRIILVTAVSDERILLRARNISVDSFWYMEIQRIPLIEIMDRTMAVEHLFPEHPPVINLGLTNSSHLTAREMDVPHLLCDGLTDREIAESLFLSITTIRYHINNLISKTGFNSRTELAIHAIRSGITIPGWNNHHK